MYRLPLNPEPIAVERDPFPTIKCFDCGKPTTSMNGEMRCAPCDLIWLLECERALRWLVGPVFWM